MSATKFNRGDTVKSIRDSSQGTAIGYVDSIVGVPMYIVSIVKAKDKQEYPGECTDVYIDETELVKVGECEEVAFRGEFNVDFEFPLKAMVRHIVNSEVTGMVTRRTVFSNGCHYYYINTNKFDKDNKPVEMFLSAELLALDTDEKTKKEKLDTTKKPRTGGPIGNVVNPNDVCRQTQNRW